MGYSGLGWPRGDRINPYLQPNGHEWKGFPQPTGIGDKTWSNRLVANYLHTWDDLLQVTPQISEGFF